MFRFLVIVLLFASAGCRTDSDQHKTTDNPPPPLPVQQRMNTEPPLQLAQLKQDDRITVRSGLATMDWVTRKNYCKPIEEGRFAFYYLSHKHAVQKGPYGLLMVYGATAPAWGDTASDERFIEITLKADRLALWDSVRVGMKKTELMRMLGDDGWSRDGTSYFKTLGGYGSEFIIIDSLVTQVRVGMYCAE